MPVDTKTLPALPDAVAVMSSEDLERDIVALGVGLWGRMARWLALVAEFDRRDAARDLGFRSTADWLAWRCDVGKRAAREHVRVARRLREMPLVSTAFRDGEVSYSKVRALTRACSTEDEGWLLDQATRSTADGLERTVRALRSAPSADLATANAAYERRHLTYRWEADGSLRLMGSLPPEDGAAVIEAIETAAEALCPPPTAESADAEPAREASRLESAGASAPPETVTTPDRPRGTEGATGPTPAASIARRPPLSVRRADALAEIAHSGCPRTHVVLHVDEAALSCTATAPQEAAGEICALRDGPAVPSETARRLACDAILELAGATSGGPLDHGRARRVVSPALRRSLERRDGGCRFPGCGRRHGADAHHIEHWAHGGPTDRDNLVLLCPFHHRLVHEEGFKVEADGNDFAFRTPTGRLITDRPPPDEKVAA